MRDGVLQPSVHGGFHDGVGEFYGDDQLAGRPIKVRFLSGATWETNWIAVDRRVHR